MARGSENTNGKLVKWCEGPEKTFPNRLRYTEQEERVRVHEYTVYPKKKEKKERKKSWKLAELETNLPAFLLVSNSAVRLVDSNHIPLDNLSRLRLSQ